VNILHVRVGRMISSNALDHVVLLGSKYDDRFLFFSQFYVPRFIFKSEMRKLRDEQEYGSLRQA
jgi:hypothetical protein